MIKALGGEHRVGRTTASRSRLVIVLHGAVPHAGILGASFRRREVFGVSVVEWCVASNRTSRAGRRARRHPRCAHASIIASARLPEGRAHLDILVMSRRCQTDVTGLNSQIRMTMFLSHFQAERFDFRLKRIACQCESRSSIWFTSVAGWRRGRALHAVQAGEGGCE